MKHTICDIRGCLLIVKHQSDGVLIMNVSRLSPSNCIWVKEEHSAVCLSSRKLLKWNKNGAQKQQNNNKRPKFQNIDHRRSNPATNKTHNWTQQQNTVGFYQKPQILSLPECIITLLWGWFYFYQIKKRKAKPHVPPRPHQYLKHIRQINNGNFFVNASWRLFKLKRSPGSVAAIVSLCFYLSLI